MSSFPLTYRQVLQLFPPLGGWATIRLRFWSAAEESVIAYEAGRIDLVAWDVVQWRQGQNSRYAFLGFRCPCDSKTSKSRKVHGKTKTMAADI